MSGISSLGSSSTSSTYYSPLDTNKDGIVDAQELQAAAKSGLLSASVSSDENTDDSTDSTDSSATDKFSGNLVGMLLQQMQQQSSTSTDGTSSTNPVLIRSSPAWTPTATARFPPANSLRAVRSP
jgi:hypothetical protein